MGSPRPTRRIWSPRQPHRLRQSSARVLESTRQTRRRFRLDDLNSVGEPYTENYLRQLVVAIEATPVFLGGLGQLEDHGERGLVRETSFGAHCSVADRREW
jgi:hypothetical protein